MNGNVMEGTTSNSPPAKASSSKNNKKTKLSTFTSDTSANVAAHNETSASTSKAGSSTSKKKIKQNPSTESEGTLTKTILTKSMKEYCYQENNTWWDIKISGKWQWTIIVKGDFGIAFCQYRFHTNTFEFVIYTNISCFNLRKYKTSIHWDNNGTKRKKTLKIEMGEEYDWKLTVPDWKNEGFKDKGKIKVNIRLNNTPEDAESNNEMITE